MDDIIVTGYNKKVNWCPLDEQDQKHVVHVFQASVNKEQKYGIWGPIYELKSGLNRFKNLETQFKSVSLSSRQILNTLYE